ncbi:hypothetical protein [Kitasatospora cystarginea]
MAGRHSRLPEPRQQSDGDTDQYLKALTTGRPVVEEGVSVPDGGDRVFLSRRVFHPDGRVYTCLVRLDATGIFPFPPPDRPPIEEP